MTVKSQSKQGENKSTTPKIPKAQDDNDTSQKEKD